MPKSSGRDPFALRAILSARGISHDAAVIPDLVFGLELADGSRRNFLVEIDRGTMPVTCSDPAQTSFERKMRVYFSAHAGKRHQRQFGWKNFRVFVVTTDGARMQTMIEALQRLRVPRSAGPSPFLFATFGDLALLTRST